MTPKKQLSVSHSYFPATTPAPVRGHRRKMMQIQNQKSKQGNRGFRRDLEALINKVISHPLNNHVTLSWCHWFFIDAKNQSLPSSLYSDTSRPLQDESQNNKEPVGNWDISLILEGIHHLLVKIFHFPVLGRWFHVQVQSNHPL